MRVKTCSILFCMLLISGAVVGQVKTERLLRGKVIKQYSVDKEGNYHGALTMRLNTGTFILKSNYLHSDLHGNYIEYTDGGIPLEESTYWKGQLTSQKKYQYFGAKRYLMYSATWSKKGILLTEGRRMYSDYTGLSDWIDLAGQLPNGRWYLSGYTKESNYVEKYNGNDTTYVWFDKTKKQFRGKGIEPRGYIYEW